MRSAPCPAGRVVSPDRVVAEDVAEWIKGSWFFAVPLVAMSSYDDLREQITEPLRELPIENRAPEDVFRDRRSISAVAVEGR